jgi:hypothetical protein
VFNSEWLLPLDKLDSIYLMIICLPDDKMASAETLNWLELLLKHAYCWYCFLILLLRTSILEIAQIVLLPLYYPGLEQSKSEN